MRGAWKKIAVMAAVTAGLCLSPYRIALSPTSIQVTSNEARAEDGGDAGDNDNDNDNADAEEMDNGGTIPVTEEGTLTGRAAFSVIADRNLGIAASATVGIAVEKAVNTAIRDGQDPELAAVNAARDGISALAARGGIRDTDIDADMVEAIRDALDRAAQAKGGSSNNNQADRN
jgi:predicted secreted protein